MATEYKVIIPKKISANPLLDRAEANYDPNSFRNRYGRLKQLNLDYGNIVTKFPTPTEIDYQVGIINRYFIQRKGVKGYPIFEVEQKKLSRKLVATRLFKVVTIKWKIAGSIMDKYENGVFIPGVTTVNQKEIDAVSDIMPDLKRHLVNLTQFHKG